MNVSTPHPIRFTAASGQNLESVNQLRKDIKKAGEKQDDLILKPANQDAPQTRMSQGTSKLKVGGLVLAGMASLVGLGTAGYSSFQSYRAARPSAAVVQQDDLLRPDWQTLQGTAETAKKTNGAQDPALQGKFYTQLNTFMIRLVKTMADTPGGELDKNLVEMMLRNSDFMPWKNAYPIAADYTTFMDRELAKMGTTTAKATGDQLDQVDVLNGFVNKVDTFSNLTNTQRSDLARELKIKFKQKHAEDPTFIQPAFFTSTITGVLGSGIEGVTLQQFQNIQTKEDAKKLVSTVVDNSANYKNFTPGQRVAMKNRMNEVLDSLNHYSPSFGWGAGALLLLSLGAAGAVGLTVLKGKHVLELGSGISDVSKGLKHPTLFINTADLSNPEAERQLSLMSMMIRFQAGEMARLMKDSYLNNAEVRKMLAATYPDEKSLPDADTFIAKYIYQSKVNIMGGRSLKEKLAETPIEELVFTQQVLNLMEDDFEKGNYAAVDLPKELQMGAPTKEEIAKVTNPVDKLQLERRRIEGDLRKAMNFLANRNFAYFKDTDSTNRLQSQLDTMFDKYEAEKDKLSDGDRKVREKELADQNALVELAKGKQKRSLATLNSTKLSIGKSVNELRQYQLKLTDSVAKAMTADAREELKSMEQQFTRSLEDPTLKQIIEDAELAHYIDEAKKEQKQEDQQSIELNKLVEAAIQQTLASEAKANGSTK